MNRKLLALLVGSSLVFAPGAVLAEDDDADSDFPENEEGSRDHPAIKRYPGSVIEQNYLEREFESFRFPVGGGKHETAEGRFYRAEYRFPNKTSCTQVLRNFENAFRAQGMKTVTGNEYPEPVMNQANDQLSLYADERWVTGIGSGKAGGKTYVLQTCGDYNSSTVIKGMLVVVETAKMNQKIEITADFMAEEMEKSGRIALYGINFATGKADITPDSAKTLAEIANLLNEREDWKIRIEGHTDNVGNAKANLELSKKRARAVKDWLSAKLQVDAARLTTDGFGDGKPVADNATEDGRAKNRRVELVKL